MKTDFEPEVEVRPPSVSARRRVRRWLRRALRPLCMAGVAGALALSLTVTTTVKAEATPAVAVLPVIAAAEAVLGGGVAISLPSLLATSLAVHPVGWGIAAAVAIGVGLYATKDYWLPYVNGDFGAPKDQTETATTTKGFHTVDYVRSGNSFALSIKWPSYPTQARYLYFGVLAKCKNNSTAAVGYKFSGGYINIGNSGAAGTNAQTVVPCPSTHTTLAWKIGGGQGPAAGSYTPNLDTSTGQPAAMNGLVSQYDWQSVGVQAGGEWGAAAFDPKSPDTKYRSEVECVAADGTKSLISAVTPGDAGAIRMPSCEAAGKGHGTGAYKIYGTPPGTTIEGTQPLETQAAPTADPSRPLCDPNKGGAPCKLGVQLDGKPCVVGSFECQNWSSLKNDPNWSTRLSCQYGVYAVPMASCNPLERAYELGGAPATDANTDGNPDTRSDTDATGQPQPKPDAPPTTGTLPTTGTNPGSNPGEDGKNCLAEGWTWNPVSWVMVPVQCALQWAFVPPKLKIDTALATITPRLEARGIQPFITPVVAGVSGLGGGGCSGPAIDLSVIHLPTFYPFSACEAPMSTIATGVSAFFGLSIIIQGGMSCIRGAAAAFGFNWGLGSKTDES